MVETEEPPFLWYYALGRAPERLEGGFATREEATLVGLAAATEDYGHVLLLEARSERLRADVFSADLVLDDLIERNLELTDADGEVGTDRATSRQRRDLEAELERTLDAWLVRHGYERSRTLSDVRKEVVISALAPQGRSEEDLS